MTTPHPHTSARGSAEEAALGQAHSLSDRARHLPTAGDIAGGVALGVILIGLMFLPLIFH